MQAHRKPYENLCEQCCVAFTGIEIDSMPHLKAWLKRIEGRPAVQRGLDIPEENNHKQIARDPDKQKELIEEAQKMTPGLT